MLCIFVMYTAFLSTGNTANTFLVTGSLLTCKVDRISKHLSAERNHGKPRELVKSKLRVNKYPIITTRISASRPDG